MSWTKIEAIGGVQPEPRDQHCMANVGNKLYVFGGQAKLRAFNDIWEFNIDSKQWRKIEARGKIPTERWGSTLTAVGGKLYLIGGQHVDGLISELLVFDPATSEWSEPAQTGTAPSPRASHSATLGCDTDIIVFGGKGLRDVELNDVVILHTPTMEWYAVHPAGEAPPPRKRHTAVLHNNSRLLIFAGWQGRRNCTASYRSDLYVLHMESMEWELVRQRGAIPDARGGHFAGIVGGRMFLWGGWGSAKSTFNELHYLDMDDFSWLKQKRGVFPSERFNHAGAMVNNQMWIWGGSLKDHTHTDEMWALDVSALY